MYRVIAYVDGYNLYYGLRAKGWKSLYWLDIRSLVRNLVKPDQYLVHTKYFTARVSSTAADPRKSKRQGTYLEALETLPDFSIYYGHYLPKLVACHKCGSVWVTHEEKMTDVNIAVELLSDAYEDAFDTALLVSGDSDLSGAVQRTQALFSGKRVVVAFPPARASERLRNLATASFTIGRAILAKSLFPPVLTKADGYRLCKPPEWN